ncbi:hypothetical protein QYF36_017171 [Acer negundo]|nr:hypothetical protein QYF36_017171 [Acer negundo]
MKNLLTDAVRSERLDKLKDDLSRKWCERSQPKQSSSLLWRRLSSLKRSSEFSELKSLLEKLVKDCFMIFINYSGVLVAAIRA